MAAPITRRQFLQVAAAAPVVPLVAEEANAGLLHKHQSCDGWVRGKMTGSEALVLSLQAEGTTVVFGIPGAQQNDLWDMMKSRCLPYVLVTHENAASMAADGYARSTGQPGVVCVVPGPGITNALTGIGEAKLDSVPMVIIAGDVARGKDYHPFQVHAFCQQDLLRPVCKEVLTACKASDIAQVVRQAFALARSGEPGPVGVVVSYPLLSEMAEFDAGPVVIDAPMDLSATERALSLLANRKKRVGIYAGMGCMDYAPMLCQVAEILQAPVATSVSGKGVIDDNHPLAVGWGYGTYGTRTAEKVFKDVDVLLAIGVKYSEVSTASYSVPEHPCTIQVDIEPRNIGRVVCADVKVCSDAGAFLQQVIDHRDQLCRPSNGHLQNRISKLKQVEYRRNTKDEKTCGIDPMAFMLALRAATCPDALVFMDVSQSEHFAAEAYSVHQPRTYFNPVDNQAMGWSIPAAIGGQIAHPGRQTVAIVGDGCMMMTAMELATAARLCLPVKFFILDDQTYHYMQSLQMAAYDRTTATVLPRLDYAALATAMGVGYQEIVADCELDSGIRGALEQPGPVLVRVITDYGDRQVRWINTVKKTTLARMSTDQKVRTVSRVLGRAICVRDPMND